MGSCCLALTLLFQLSSHLRGTVNENSSTLLVCSFDLVSPHSSSIFVLSALLVASGAPLACTISFMSSVMFFAVVSSFIMLTKFDAIFLCSVLLGRYSILLPSLWPECYMLSAILSGVSMLCELYCLYCTLSALVRLYYTLSADCASVQYYAVCRAHCSLTQILLLA